MAVTSISIMMYGHEVRHVKQVEAGIGAFPNASARPVRISPEEMHIGEPATVR
jgi:hypothetical protein